MEHNRISFVLIIFISSVFLSCQSQRTIKKMESSYDKTFSTFINNSMNEEEIDFANNWKSYIFENRQNLFNHFSIQLDVDKPFILIEEVDNSNGNYSSNLIENDKVYSLTKRDYDDSPDFSDRLFFNQRIIDILKEGDIATLKKYSKNPDLISSHDSFIFTIGKEGSIDTYTMDAFDLDTSPN